MLRTRLPVASRCIATPLLPHDLHVLSLPLAFILSQDQTLHCKWVWIDLVNQILNNNATLLTSVFYCRMLLFPNFQRSFQLFADPHFFDGSAKVAALSIPAKFFLIFFQAFFRLRIPFDLTFLRTTRLFFKAGCKYRPKYIPAKLFLKKFLHNCSRRLYHNPANTLHYCVSRKSENVKVWMCDFEFVCNTQCPMPYAQCLLQ